MIRFKPLTPKEVDTIEGSAPDLLAAHPDKTGATIILRLVATIRDREEELVAYAATRNEESFPDEIVARLVDGENPVRVYRHHRAMTLAALHDASGVSTAYLSEIETGKKPGSAASLKKIATALNVALDDLV